MTSLTMSPLMVGLVQAAGSIAVFLVVLPAGAMADVVDRRKLLLFTQTWMVVAAAGLGVLTLAGKITPALLLLFTLLMGFGAVLNDPAWQAITPEIVSHQNFTAGIALNSAGFNVARAIGPALGGLVIAATSSGIAFLLNALSFFGVIYFLYQWKRRPGRISLRADHMFNAMFAGFRHMRQLIRSEGGAGAQRRVQHFSQRAAGPVAAAGASVWLARLRPAARFLRSRSPAGSDPNSVLPPHGFG